MKLDASQTRLLYENVQDWGDRRSTRYNKLAESISNDLKKYERKNLLAIDYVNSPLGEKTPLLFFAEYKSVDPYTFSGFGPYLIFKKPILFSYIKLNKNKMERSSIRYLWRKTTGQRLWPFRGGNDFDVSVQTTNCFGLIYKNNLVFDTGIQNELRHETESPCNTWETVSEVFRRDVREEPNYQNLYALFEKKFMTSLSLE